MRKLTREEKQEVEKLFELLDSPDTEAKDLALRIVQTSKWYKELGTSQLYVIDRGYYSDQVYYMPRIFSPDQGYYRIARDVLEMFYFNETRNSKYRLVRIVKYD